MQNFGKGMGLCPFICSKLRSVINMHISAPEKKFYQSELLVLMIV